MTDIEPGIAHPDAQAPPPPVEFYRGTRKMTSETKISMDLLDKGIPKDHGVTRQAAWALAKQTAAALELGVAAQRLLDVLFGYSNDIDFTAGDDPTVWPSNQTLARDCGHTDTNAVAKTLSILTQAGLIIHTDAHCVPRRGRRSKDGRIIESHGISLSAFITRHHQFQLIVAKYQKRMSLLLSGKADRTNLIAEVKAAINAGSAATAIDWQDYQARLDVIRERQFKEPEELAERITELRLLLGDCKNELSAAFENDDDDEEAAETAMEPDAANQAASLPVEIRLDVAAKPAEPESEASKSPAAEAEQAEPPPKPEKWTLDGPLIEAAVPAVRELLPGPQTWQDYKNIGRYLVREFGSGDIVWEEAVQAVGGDVATAIAMLVYQKFKKVATGDKPIEKPAAYMRKLVERAGSGKLRLAQSYNALARKNAAADPNHLRNTGFPLESSIRYTKWYEITKEHIPPRAKNLNVDVIANAFRISMRKKNIDLTNPIIEERYVNFCQHWKVGKHSRTIH